MLFRSPSSPRRIYDRRPVGSPPEALALKFFGRLEKLKVPAEWRQAIFQRAMSKGSGENSQGHQLTHGEIADSFIKRIHEEFHLPGVAEAVPLTFKMKGFDKEYEDRTNFLFAQMSMPVCFIQGELDPGQHRQDYKGIEQVRPNFSIRWINDVGHFLHLEKPQAVNEALLSFFGSDKAAAKGLV